MLTRQKKLCNPDSASTNSPSFWKRIVFYFSCAKLNIPRGMTPVLNYHIKNIEIWQIIIKYSYKSKGAGYQLRK